MAASIIPPSPMTRGNVAALLERGIRKVYFNEYMLALKQFEALYNIDGSVKRQETDVVFAGLGQFKKKPEGAPPELDAGAQAWTQQYVHNTWALALKITQEALEDELYGVFLRMAKELAQAAVYTQELDAMTLLNNLAATVYTAGGTGYTLLSTTHFRADGGTWSNQLSSGADLSIESLEALLTQWTTGMLDQRGRKQATMPEKLVVGASDWAVAERILNSIQRPFTADNDINPIRRWNLKAHVMTHLTDDGRWFLLGPTEQTGLNWFNRRPISMQRETDGIGTGNVLMTGSSRWSAGATHVTGVMGST